MKKIIKKINNKRITALFLAGLMSLTLALLLPSHASAGFYEKLMEQMKKAEEANRGSNLVVNGGFEYGLMGWNCDTSEWGNCNTEYLRPHSGNCYAWPYKKGASGPWIWQEIWLKEDYSDLPFNFTVWIGGDPDSGLEDSYAELFIYGEDQENPLFYRGWKNHAAYWTKYEVNDIFPEGAKRVYIKLSGERLSGTLCDSYFDDVSLTIPKKTFMVNGVSYLITKEAKPGQPGECSIEKCPQGKFSTAALNTVTRKTGVAGLVTQTYNVTGVRGMAFKGYNFGPEYNNNPTTIIQLYQMKTIGPEAFAGCSGVKEFWLNSEKIGMKAFNGCSSVEYVYLGSKTKTVNNGAFAGCSALKKIRIKSNVASIAEGAIPSTVTIERK